MSTQSQIDSNLASVGLYNSSAASIENQIAQSLGVIVDNTITEMSNSEALINLTISQKNYGKAGYYIYWAKYFQYGDTLSVSTTNDPTTGQPSLVYYYAVINTSPSVKIITQAAFVGTDGNLFIKVATLNTVTNLLQPLNSLQLAAFTAYFLLFELPGLPVAIVNNAANILNFNAVATFLATYDLTTIQTGIYNALVSFRDTFNFNGILYITQLETYITANVPGMISFFTSSQQIDGTPITGGNSALSSGYFNYFAALLNNPSSQINYVGV